MKLFPKLANVLLPVIIVFSVTGLSCSKKDSSPPDRYAQLRENVPVQYKAFVNPFGDGSTIGAAVNLAYDIVLLFDNNGTRYAWYQNKKIQGVYHLNDASGPLKSGSMIDSIGAAMEYPQGSVNNLILLFDPRGATYTGVFYSKSQFSASDTSMPSNLSFNWAINVVNTSALGGPFASTGYEAAVEYVRPYSGDTAWHIFDKGGARYARYVYGSPWGPITQFTAWGGNNNLFAEVGAASLITLNGINYNIFISRDGSKMGVWHLEGSTSVFEGPWQIN